MKQDATVFLLGGFGVQKQGEAPFFQLEIIDLSSIEGFVAGVQKVTYSEPDLSHFKKGSMKDEKQFYNLNVASGLFICDLLQVIKRDRASGLMVARYSLMNLRPHKRDFTSWLANLDDVHVPGSMNVASYSEVKNGSGVVTGISPPKSDRLAGLMS